MEWQKVSRAQCFGIEVFQHSNLSKIELFSFVLQASLPMAGPTTQHRTQVRLRSAAERFFGNFDLSRSEGGRRPCRGRDNAGLGPLLEDEQKQQPPVLKKLDESIIRDSQEVEEQGLSFRAIVKLVWAWNPDYTSKMERPIAG